MFACWMPTPQLQLIFSFRPYERAQKLPLRIRLFQLDGFALGDQGQGKASRRLGPWGLTRICLARLAYKEP